MSCAADPKGVRQDAWNKVGHRRGVNKVRKATLFGWPFCFWVSGNEVLLHGKPCDKIVWNNFALRVVCADPEGVEGRTARNKVGHRRGINTKSPLHSQRAFFVLENYLFNAFLCSVDPDLRLGHDERN